MEETPQSKERVANWIKKQSQLYAVYKRLILVKYKEIHGLNAKGWKKIVYQMNQKRADVPILRENKR